MKNLQPLIAAFCLSLLVLPALSAPNIVVSIKPLHGLVSAIVTGVSEPELLIQGSASPHDYALKPSDASKLQNADIVFWIGPDLETALGASIQNLASHAQVYDFTNYQNDLGPHVWLDPQIAIQMSRKIVQIMGEMDPPNAMRYEENAQQFSSKVLELEDQIHQQLSSVTDQPFLTYHDAFTYFTGRFSLMQLGFVTLSEVQKPGARRIQTLRRMIVENDIKCIFSEPQFDAKIISVLLEATNAKQGVLDPIGAEIQMGANHYYELLQNLADDISLCLAN